ncbi:MAG TPA: hypothetical protein VNL39_05005, partial [Xanthobacteraceae bacterium]|nr:hypothetical protein [Xanthobacteraceae bacterium]
RIGLLNERGAELVIRKSTISSDTSLSESFREVQAVMAEISALIARAVTDEIASRKLQRLTIRYVARKMFDLLILHRRQGASLIKLARQFWIWRTQAPHCTFIDFLAVLRLRTLFLLVLPVSAIKLLISVREIFKKTTFRQGGVVAER